MKRNRTVTISDMQYDKVNSFVIDEKHTLNKRGFLSGMSLRYFSNSLPDVSKGNDQFCNCSTPPEKKTVALLDGRGKRILLKKYKKNKKGNAVKIINESKNKQMLDISSMDLDRISPDIGNLTCLRELFAYENRISFIPPQIGNLIMLEKVWLQENCLSVIPREIQSCTNITHLDLRHNKLEGRMPEGILKLKGLKQLLLTYNKLTDIDGIGSLSSLQTLVLKSNNLTGSLPPCIGQLIHLNTLDVSKNRITTVPLEISQCVKLTRLHLDHNQIDQLPETVCDLKSLALLGIKYNNLKTLPESLKQCKELTEINIEGNSIENLPPNLFLALPLVSSVILARNWFRQFPFSKPEQYRQLKHLSLDYNCLEEIQRSTLTEATQLAILSLSNNNIPSLADTGITQLTSLIELDLSYNPIEEMPEEIGSLQCLQMLDFTSNRLRSIPKSIGKLKNLRDLKLQFNQISHLPNEVGELISLQKLNLDSNQLSRLPSSIGNLTNLIEFKLTDNVLQRLPVEIGKLGKLTHLQLKNNKPLDNLPMELALIPSLAFMSLDGCNLRQLPADVVQVGSAAVIRYFRSLLRTRVELTRQLELLSLTNKQEEVNSNSSVSHSQTSSDCK